MRIIFTIMSLILIAGLSACQGSADDLLQPENGNPTTTPQIASTATSAPTATVADITTEPTSAAVSSTSLPTGTAESSPTPLATSIPTETPIPSAPASSVSLVPILENAFQRPLYLTHAYDDRLFVVEQAGLIRIIVEGELLAQPFLDIRDRIGSSQLEQGLLGLAFHPNYQENGRFFVNYTDKSGDTHIARFEVSQNDPNIANPDSEVTLLVIDQPYANHNGGQVAFGPDGYLYIGVGDGGSANDPLNSGQDPSTLLGTILRLDVDFDDNSYAIPPTNPFIADETRANEIWAWGLRNPWRFSFDRYSGDLYIADVGQNMWEEVHFQPASSPGGENYGWNIMEGTHCFSSQDCDTSGLEIPIYEYDHQSGCSITGGYVYRGSQHPSLYGNYFFSDFCQGNIWRLFPNEDGSWQGEIILQVNIIASSYGEDFQGELYMMDHTAGSLYQINP